ncbi:hypothetical protein M2475_002189 [Breznakia sp. PF5-3]|uniref:hypothetical protein n=1 Tax=unclassified Breznakia TaxID=2623764 RepID=UPI0024052E3A|nr:MULTISPECIES: hypothetical protein [unclassified Breznakia]MDL2276516.1 hypothetical protein [Breznakia sp. OttesenSCG-928-G09]MDF9825803.1 hypothetical protein [Breznakia sp. PM6-1]MDF9836608.1 hypothetical protein [Breznakia sp. PF5-3]MDF9838842.1 hypothetical protein [Breznakia sp. PFB2-8]MDF9860868.1 hypothetical protein [Breznakia sp. PH5-24]
MQYQKSITLLLLLTAIVMSTSNETPSGEECMKCLVNQSDDSQIANVEENEDGLIVVLDLSKYDGRIQVDEPAKIKK